MSLQTINNGDSGLVAREKINAAINAINAMSTTTTSTSTTTAPTTTSSTTSTSTTTQPTTTSSTTTSSTTTSSTSTTTMPTEYNYMITNCAGGASYTITTTMFLSSAVVYKFFAPGAAYDTNACWQVTPSGMGGTLSTVTNTFGTCIECTSGTTSSSTTTSSTSTTTYTPPPTTTSTTTIP
jgi:hypothetical protein